MEAFLRNHITKGKPYTHTSILNPTGCFNIPDNELNKFYILYEANVNAGIKMYFTECNLDIASPIKLDIDLKTSSTTKSRLYKPSTYKKLIQFYRNTLLKACDLDSTEKFLAVVLEKEAPTTKNKTTKDGFHIVFPNTIVPYEVQYYLRRKALEPTNFNHIFEETIYENDPKDIIDEAIIKRNNWSLYGSLSKIDGLPYKITQIYKLSKNPEIKEFRVSKLEIPTSDLTKFMSIRNNQVNVKVKIQIDPEPLNIPIPTIQGDKNQIELARALLKILSYKRADNYNEWIQIGWCLSTVSHELLQDWIVFSQKSPKFKPGECEKIWSKAKSGLTIASLFFWAKHDNPTKYQEVMANHIKPQAEKMSNSHRDIAEIIHTLHKHEYIYLNSLSERKRGWYHYTTHRWEYQHDGSDIRNLMSTEICDIYIGLNKRFNALLREAEASEKSDAEKALYKDKAKNALSIAKMLRNRTFKLCVLGESEDLFRDRQFEAKLDSNPYLLAFNNGIYDLKNEIFRPGVPEDFVSLNTKIDHIPYKDTNITSVLDFIKDILPDKQVRKYLMLVSASCLDYVNREEKFYILTGQGRNGKSKFMELLMSSLGEYACSLPITLITRKRGESSRPTPEIVKMQNRRIGLLKEPDNMSDNVLNVGMIKDLTGNDTISARNLHENDNEFKVSTKLFLMCNTLPDVNSNDDGTWDRFRVIHFPIRFCDNPKTPTEKQIDRNLGEKIKQWRPAFMALLIEFYKKYKSLNGIPEPPGIIEHTNKYRERNDIFREFIKERLTTTKDTAVITTALLYQEFKGWFADNYPNRKLPVKKEMVSFLSTFFGKDYDGKQIKQYKFKDNQQTKEKDTLEPSE